MEYTYRLVTENDGALIRQIFDYDPKFVGIELSADEQNKFVDYIINYVNTSRVAVIVLDETNTTAALTVGTKIVAAHTWFKNISKIRKPNNYYPTTAKIMAPAEDMLIQHMEDQTYYGFIAATKEHKYHTLRNGILRRYSKMLPRYDGFDEVIIPAGEKTNIELWDRPRRVHPTEDILLRKYMLRQEYRIPLVRKDFEEKLKKK